jgi:hypothetical protein
MPSQTGLDALHDVVAPPPVSWMPQTPAWYVLGALLLVALAWLAWRWWRRRQANRYRSAALVELAAIGAAFTDPQRRLEELQRIQEVLKRAALVAYPRQTVASLTGEEWLRFLDAGYGGQGFTQGPGRLLPEIAYGPTEPLQALSEIDRSELLALAKKWVKHHRATPPQDEEAA